MPLAFLNSMVCERVSLKTAANPLKVFLVPTADLGQAHESACARALYQI